MTIRRLFLCRLPLLAVLCFSFCVSGLSAQDAEKATPKVVKLKLENERVRVLEALSNPGDKENMHSHPANIVYGTALGAAQLNATHHHFGRQDVRGGIQGRRHALARARDPQGREHRHDAVPCHHRRAQAALNVIFPDLESVFRR